MIFTGPFDQAGKFHRAGISASPFWSSHWAWWSQTFSSPLSCLPKALRHLAFTLGIKIKSTSISHSHIWLHVLKLTSHLTYILDIFRSLVEGADEACLSFYIKGVGTNYQFIILKLTVLSLIIRPTQFVLYPKQRKRISSPWIIGILSLTDSFV
jgi:hypothetical protein